MGIDIRIESEDGIEEAVIFDPFQLTVLLLPKLDDQSSPCLRFVDPYGDTTFNQLQLPFLALEIEEIIDDITDPAAKAHGNAILELAKRAGSKVHTYLKFYGE